MCLMRLFIGPGKNFEGKELLGIRDSKNRNFTGRTKPEIKSFKASRYCDSLVIL